MKRAVIVSVLDYCLNKFGFGSRKLPSHNFDMCRNT